MERLALFLLLSVSSVVHAGVISGGGGKSIVCRNNDSTIRSAEVLDLYEGRVQYGLSYDESTLSWQDQIEKIFSELESGVMAPGSNIFVRDVHHRYLNIIQNLRFLPQGASLIPIDDSLEVIAPQNCMTEQTVNYQNDQLILVNGEIWESLSETQRAALLIHESTYHFLRERGEKDSRRARHFTAHLVSGGRVEDISPGSDDYGWCVNSDQTQPATLFYIRPPHIDEYGNKAIRLQFAMMGGRTLFTKSFVDVGNEPLQLPSGEIIPSTATI